MLEEYRQHQLALEQQRVAMEMKEQQQQRIQEERRVRAEAALVSCGYVRLPWADLMVC